MSLRNKALAGVYWTGIHSAGSQALSFLISIVLARLLLPSEFGLIAALTVFISIGHLLIGSGLCSSIIRTPHLRESDLSTVFYFNLVGSVVVYIIVYFIAPLVAAFYNQEILTSLLRVLAIGFIIQAFSAVQNARLVKSMNFKKLTLIGIPSLLAGAAVAVYMAMSGYGVWSLVGQSLTIAIVNSTLLWTLSGWTPSIIFDKAAFRKHFDFGYKVTLSGILNTIFDQVYVILIGRYFPMAQAGYYQRANSLAHYPSKTLSSIVHKVSYPLLSEMQEEKERLRSNYAKMLKAIVFCVAPILATMAVMGTPLFRWLFTEKWLPAVPYFQILTMVAILYPVHAFNLQILNVKGRSDLFLKAEVVKKLIVITIIAFVFRYGIYGLLLGSVAGSVLALFVNTYYSSQVLDYSLGRQVRDLLPAFILALAVSGGVYVIDLSLQAAAVSDLVRLVVSGAVATTFLYLFLSLFYKELMKEGRQLTKMIMK